MENDFEISKLTTFKVGGKIKKLYLPASIEEFVEILKSEPNAKVLGNLSNVLISSNGYSGTVILTTKLDKVSVNGNQIEVMCGIKNPKLAQFTAEKGLSGFEFMIGFPGTIGGNICMNASAHGQCISDNLISAKCFYNGEIKELSKDDFKFSYRNSICQSEKIIVLSAKFELKNADKDLILQKMEENLNFRKTHQPSLSLPNCGSVFKNPQNDSAGRLLDLVGAKQMTFGGAKVWENHANFIINHNNATSLDILKLMEKMSKEVENKFGIKLIPEVKFLGSNKEEEELCRKLQIELI